jgi:sugar/nucleoside kinase (ribokinase family)
LPAEQTTTFENIYEPEGRKQFVRGIAAPIGVSDIPAHFLRAPLVHLAPIIGEGDPGIAHLFKDAIVLLTLQGWLRRVDADGRVRFKRWHDPNPLKWIDMVVFSEEDIVEDPDMEQNFAQSVSNLFVTRAERGGTYYRNGDPLTYDTPQVPMVNPTGAGDVFAASLLASLPALNYDLFAATRVAARLGAICVTRPGLEGTPTPEEAQMALREAVRA